MGGRQLVAALFALALLVGLFFFTRGERRGGPAAPRTAEAPDERAPASLEDVDVPAPEPATTVPAPRAALATETEEEPTPEDVFVLVGRVVDEADLPLSGVTVQLASFGTWAEGHDVPYLPGSDLYRGWEASSDAEGRFRFQGPPPTCERHWIVITPGPFHDEASLFYGSGQPRPVLRAGKSDAGTFRLATTGAIRGTVRDAHGNPIAGAELDVGPEPSLTIDRGAQSDPNGDFLVGHVVPGSHGLQAKAEGYLSQFKEPVEVEGGRTTEGIAFVLENAPTISGYVLDERGQPLEGVKLWGWPQSSGSGAGARSLADGSFTLHLPQDEPYTLEAKLAGYDGFGVDDRTKHYAPGTEDLEVVLSRRDQTLFRVVDKETREPIERFGLRVLASDVSYSTPPDLHDHPGGEVELAGKHDDNLEVAASGYREVKGKVAFDEPGISVMTVELDRGATVRGRVVDTAGLPVEGARLQLTPGYTARKRGKAGKDGQTEFRVNRGAWTIAGSTDAGGVFELIGAGHGEFLLEAHGDSGPPARVESLRIGPRDTELDAGDLVLHPGATILGSVLPPPGISPGGLTVYLGRWQENLSRTTDSNGTFRFEDLPPGVHSLRLEEAPGRVAAVEASVETRPGEASEVEIDASRHGMCAVTLDVRLGPEAVPGIRVQLRPVDDPESPIYVGDTDAEGRVRGYARAAGEVEVEVYTPAWTRLVHGTVRPVLIQGRDVEETVVFPVATVRTRIPDDVVLPQLALVSILLRTPGADSGPTASIRVADGLPPAAGVRLEPDGRTFVFTHVPPGNYTLRFHIRDEAAERVAVPQPDGSTRLLKPLVFEAERPVNLTAGASVELDLR